MQRKDSIRIPTQSPIDEFGEYIIATTDRKHSNFIHNMNQVAKDFRFFS